MIPGGIWQRWGVPGDRSPRSCVKEGLTEEPDKHSLTETTAPRSGKWPGLIKARGTPVYTLMKDATRSRSARSGFRSVASGLEQSTWNVGCEDL